MAKAPRWIGEEEVRALGPLRAVDALEAALRGGLDPSASPAARRSSSRHGRAR